MSNNSRETAVLSQSHGQASIDLLCEYITSHKNLWKTSMESLRIDLTSIRGSDHSQESCEPSLDKSTTCYARWRLHWKHDLRLDIHKIKTRFLHHQWNLNSSFLITTVFFNLLYLSHSHSHARSHSHSHFYSHSHDNKFITNLTVFNLNLQFATQIGTDTEKSATNYSHQSKIGTRPKLPVTIMAPVWWRLNLMTKIISFQLHI